MGYTADWLTKTIQQADEIRMWQSYGEDYYRQKNTAIMDRIKLVPTETGGFVADPYKANHKLPSGYLRVLIDQKVSYSLNDRMTSDGEYVASVLGDSWKKDIQRVGRDASMKGFGVWQFWIDNGKVKRKRIPPEQIIPVYNSEDELVQVVRQYSKNNNGKQIDIAEVWDSETVTRFECETGKDWIVAGFPEQHIVTRTSYGSKTSEETGVSWGVVPFAIFKNNEYLDTDLSYIKNFIDSYDLVNSDFVNNLDDFQDSWWVLRNYDGQNLSEFFDMVKKYKAVKVSDDGEARRETAEVPHEAKTVFLDRIKGDIYEYGMGVDVTGLAKNGGQMTTVEIRSKYGNLDLKADKFEFEAEEFINTALSFYNNSVVNGSGNVQKDSVEITFDRSVLINEIELSTLANQSVGAISEETRLANDPRVKDVKYEISMMEPVIVAPTNSAPNLDSIV